MGYTGQPPLESAEGHSHDCGGSVGNVLCCDILTRCLGGVGFRASEEGQSRAAVRDIFGQRMRRDVYTPCSPVADLRVDQLRVGFVRCSEVRR